MRKRTQSPKSTNEADELYKLIRTKQNELSELKKQASLFARAGVGAALDTAIETAESEISILKASYNATRTVVTQIAETAALSRLAEIREIGAAEFWAAATDQQKNAILRYIIKHVQVEPREFKNQRVLSVKVEVQPYIAPFYNPGTIPVSYPVRRGFAVKPYSRTKKSAQP